MTDAPNSDADNLVQGPAGETKPSLAYLVGTYPTLSMIFVLREVQALRRLGFRIETASINRPDRSPSNMTAAEAAEAGRTYCVKGHGAFGAAGAIAASLSANPVGVVRGLVQAFRLSGLDLPKLFLSLMYFIEALMVGEWMRRNGLRHLHVHLASQAASVGLFVKCVFGFGYSITVHGPDEFYEASRHSLSEKIAAADFICCISSFARSQLMKLSPYQHWKKLVVSPLGVDPGHFAPRPLRSAPDPFEILCVGRLTPAKGQHLLIDAVARLAGRGLHVRLRLVGGGPDDASLRRQASALPNPEIILFEGPVNQDRIRDLYRHADAFCLPSFAEGLPVVLMEAMAMEIPCVSTQIAGIPELIRDGIDGLLVPASDLDGLVDALAIQIGDANLRDRLGRSGRKRVLEHYDISANVEKLAAIFSERV